MDELARRAEEIFQERSEEHTSELQSQSNLVCRLLLEKKSISGTSSLGGGAPISLDTLKSLPSHSLSETYSGRPPSPYSRQHPLSLPRALRPAIFSAAS